jgi:hypothetical protein
LKFCSWFTINPIEDSIVSKWNLNKIWIYFFVFLWKIAFFLTWYFYNNFFYVLYHALTQWSYVRFHDASTIIGLMEGPKNPIKYKRYHPQKMLKLIVMIILSHISIFYNLIIITIMTTSPFSHFNKMGQKLHHLNFHLTWNYLNRDLQHPDLIHIQLSFSCIFKANFNP